MYVTLCFKMYLLTAGSIKFLFKIFINHSITVECIEDKIICKVINVKLFKGVEGVEIKIKVESQIFKV